LRATATTSRRNSKGNAFGTVNILPARTKILTNQESTKPGAVPWAHMLGFGGHFLTKARHYTVTFSELRAQRTTWRRTAHQQHVDASAHPPHNRDQADTDEQTILVIGHLTYTGTGWHTTGDALLAHTAADQARERQAIARQEVAVIPPSGQQHSAAA
jgi:hypothetical protein